MEDIPVPLTVRFAGRQAINHREQCLFAAVKPSQDRMSRRGPLRIGPSSARVVMADLVIDEACMYVQTTAVTTEGVTYITGYPNRSRHAENDRSCAARWPCSFSLPSRQKPKIP